MIRHALAPLLLASSALAGASLITSPDLSHVGWLLGLVAVGVALVALLRRDGARSAWHATHDRLTGLPNRALLDDRLDQAIRRGQRDRTRVALHYVDLDGFKRVNDQLGHAAGDELLRRTARTLLAATRDVDTVARIGGDEFVVLQPDLAGDAGAAQLARRMRRDLVAAGIAASLGTAVWPRDARDAIALRKAADDAMYETKRERSG